MSDGIKEDRRNSESSGDGSSTCVVCFKTVHIYSIGCCDHPVCYECSTRMRILCKQNECPICRQEIPKVIFTTAISPFTTLLSNHSHPHTLQDRRFGLLFSSPSIQHSYNQLLEHRCHICARNNAPQERRVWPLKTFQGLKEHMRREHELFYCDLCVDNLKIFTFERRVYTRPELGMHRRKGDKDDTSHRGHPLCEFCDTRYMDSDELFRHLRRDHLFCHFCDADGKHQFYSTYNDLRNHFKTEHFLCEEGDCKNEQFTSAFRTDIDLKAHVASTHSKGMSRQANKLARTLELEFTLAPRPRQDMLQIRDNRQQRSRMNNINPPRNNITLTNTSDISNSLEHTSVDGQPYNMEPGGGGRSLSIAGGGGNNGYRGGEFADSVEEFVGYNRDVGMGDFPSLGGGTVPVPVELGTGGGGRVTFTSRVMPDFSAAEFPTLDGRVATPPPKQTIKKQKEDYPSLSGGRKWAPEVTISQEYVDAGKSDNIRRTNVKVSYKNQQDHPSSSRSSNFSIELNHKKGATANTPQINKPAATSKPQSVNKHNLQAPITSAVIKVRPPRPTSMVDAFPVLGAGAVAPAAEPSQWVQVKAKKKEESKVSKVAPAPVLPPNNDFADFPSLNKGKGKKSSSVTMPVSNNWVNLNDINKTAPQLVKQQLAKQEQQNNSSNQSDAASIKSKNKKKSSKQCKTTAENSLSPGESFEPNKNVNSDKNVHNNQNNITQMPKKRSELRIDTLHIQDGGQTIRAPPGFNQQQRTSTTKPPPGFNHVNDFTFTSSSGQSYPILPTGTVSSSGAIYRPPPNFQHRNKHLIETLLKILASSDASGDTVKEFKNYSELFRKGGYPAHKYYEHCQLVLGPDFDRIFPELLALLPDVTKQRELYRVHLEQGCHGAKLLDLCATCGQVILKGIDLKAHVTSHTFEQNFGASKTAANGNNAVPSTAVWKK